MSSTIHWHPRFVYDIYTARIPELKHKFVLRDSTSSFWPNAFVRCHKEESKLTVLICLIDSICANWAGPNVRSKHIFPAGLSLRPLEQEWNTWKIIIHSSQADRSMWTPKWELTGITWQPHRFTEAVSQLLLGFVAWSQQDCFTFPTYSVLTTLFWPIIKQN